MTRPNVAFRTLGELRAPAQHPAPVEPIGGWMTIDADEFAAATHDPNLAPYLKAAYSYAVSNVDLD